MRNAFLLFSALFLLLACKHDEKRMETKSSPTVQYATGFNIVDYHDYKIIEVQQAFPGSDQVFRYAFLPNEQSNNADPMTLPDSLDIDLLVHTPIERLVVTSTTHIPSLEMLQSENTLVGFPNTDYISSEKTRSRIDLGLIQELGQNDAINTEVLIDLNPNAVVSFGVEGQNKALSSVEKAGIPILYNGDWVEQHPLGRAEWIKFFGVLFQKEAQADSIFNQIVTDYNRVKAAANSATHKPTVLSGAMYRDTWYLPNGESWAAQLIEDAGGRYLWKNSQGTGSLSYSIEQVLDEGQAADVWIAPAQFGSYKQMNEASPAYSQFNAFQEKEVYTFTANKGATGGLMYYELAGNRPDLVLKDLVHYLHPELLVNYKPFFFSPLED